MENDSVRATGNDTVVDLWIERKFRAVTISRQAIETFLQLTPQNAASMTEKDRREFVRTHLGIVARAATDHLRIDPAAEVILVDVGQLARQS